MRAHRALRPRSGVPPHRVEPPYGAVRLRFLSSRGIPSGSSVFCNPQPPGSRRPRPPEARQEVPGPPAENARPRPLVPGRRDRAGAPGATRRRGAQQRDRGRAGAVSFSGPRRRGLPIQGLWRFGWRGPRHSCRQKQNGGATLVRPAGCWNQAEKGLKSLRGADLDMAAECVAILSDRGGTGFATPMHGGQKGPDLGRKTPFLSIGRLLSRTIQDTPGQTRAGPEGPLEVVNEWPGRPTVA